MANKTQQTNNLSELSIRDLLTYYEVSKIVHKRYENQVLGAMGNNMAGVYTQEEINFIVLKEKETSKIIENIEKEMEKRVFAL